MKIIIVGGGIIGASLALALHNSTKNGTFDITLIDNNLISNHKKNNHNNKTIAINYSTYQIFKSLGLWDETLKNYATPITNINVSEEYTGGQFNINAEDYTIPYLGYVIKIENALSSIFKKIKKTNIEIHSPVMYVNINRCIDSVSIELNNGKIIKGHLLVAADGSFSAIGKFNHIEYEYKTYKQIAVIVDIMTSIMPNGMAIEKLSKFGLLATLPIANFCSSLIWCYSIKNHKIISNWCDKIFEIELEKIFGTQLGMIKLINKRFYYPIFLAYAKQIVSHRIVIIGNAAQTIHPIAAQGFNLGMRDVFILINNIIVANKHKYDIGSYSVLIKYQKERNDDRNNVISFTDNLVNFFITKNNFLLSLCRYFGFMTMNTVPIVRNFIFSKIDKLFKSFTYDLSRIKYYRNK